jgi:hypothetical protein
MPTTADFLCPLSTVLRFTYFWKLTLAGAEENKRIIAVCMTGPKAII